MADHSSEATQATITRLLGELRQGSRHALDALLPLLYEELRILARGQRRRWRGNYTMDTTALVHEAYLKLVRQKSVSADNRAHFFALTSRAMRHILCNYARDRQARKRGGDHEVVEFDNALDVPAGATGSTDGAAQLLALDSALARLNDVHPRRGRVVECRFFGGMTVADTATALGVSPRTVKRDWAAAQEWLREEIDRLQMSGSPAPGLDELATSALPPLLDRLARSVDDELRPGQRVGKYEIVTTLGRGGMGIVYKAYDTRLDRHVALKFLPSHLAADERARARFTAEARAASALDHPHICTIYDIGEVDDHRMFLALACYEGETLKEKIARGPMPVSDTVAITVQIGEALGAAHRSGIVHRDIKPSNVMVTTDGTVKILDFGIAKLREDEQTTRGSAIGTLGYMSPEQLRGNAVDARSDLWSLGVVIHEMLTSHRPFEAADGQRLLQAMRSGPVPALTELRADLPPHLVRVVETCLQENLEARYRTADELVADLRAVDGSAATSAPVRRLAILPLESPTSGPDNEVMAEGIAEELGSRLSGLSGLHVLARTSAEKSAEPGRDAAQIGSELGADMIVRGAAAQSGDDVQITLQLVDVGRNQTVWEADRDLPVSELQNGLNTLAWQIASKLAVPVYEDERRQLARRGTDSTTAYALYLKGRHYWNKRDRARIQQARACFEAALDEDPVFALAWTGLADTFCVLGGYQLLRPEDAYPRARAAAERALALDDRLAEAHASLATVLADHYWDWPAAGQHYRRALGLAPSNAKARLWYAGFLRDLGAFDEALVQVRAARDLDPLSTPTQAAEGITLYVARRYPEALAVYRRLLEISPGYTYMYFLMALALAQEREYTEALASLRKTEGWSGGVTGVRGLSGYIHAMLGQHARAREMLSALEADAGEDHAAAFQRAVIHAALGETGPALDALEQAHQARAKHVRLFRIEPLLDAVRDEPRFQALLERAGLTDEAVARALASPDRSAPTISGTPDRRPPPTA